MNASPVLIVGAGPTGLVLAISLARRGIPLRIVDRAAEPGTTSRALVVHARTLEFYRMLGLADPVLAGGFRTEALNVHVAGRRTARAEFGDFGSGLSAFPFILTFPQDDHERVLIAALEKLGVRVERGVEFLGFSETPDAVSARLRRADGTEEELRASYLAGCDGAHSAVRRACGIEFAGEIYRHLFYVADTEATGAVVNGEIGVDLERSDFLLVFPLKGDRRVRFVGAVRPEAEAKKEKLSWQDVDPETLARLGIRVERVKWFSTYHVHHRVAADFRRGRAFLLGDAAHIHSPVGGQGMNTGIGDAVNLGWKLADVLSGRASPALLETYAPERMAFARRLVRTTDRAFSLATNDAPFVRFFRLRIFPALLARLSRYDAVKRFLFRTASQIAIQYRGCAFNAGRAGVRGGDRLPWVRFADGGDNYASLDGRAWQLQVYGKASAELAAEAARRGLRLVEFPWRAEWRGSGIREHALYVVRPDAHVAFADGRPGAESLGSFLNSRELLPGR